MENWFESWFNTEYYHQLYGDRNEGDAFNFISNLIADRGYEKRQLILDLACGKGRHSRLLNELGFNVTGVDLSPKSIEEAKEFENEQLNFFVHDMRSPLQGYSFDVVLNLFTSFGYFAKDEENMQVLRSIKSYLKKDGELIIDYMNVSKVVDNLVEYEIKRINNIDFHIRRKLKNNFIQKIIEFEVKGEKMSFVEKVRDYDLINFVNMLEINNFEIAKIAGDYELNPYDEKSSDRLIICAKNR